jgi:hypothetical protein
VNRKVLLHAVVRHDEYAREIANAVTVVAVVPTKAEAVAEVDRLNDLNAGKRCRYFWTPAKYYPDGRDAGASSESPVDAQPFDTE